MSYDITKRNFFESLGRLLDFSGDRIPYAPPPSLRYGVDLHAAAVDKLVAKAMRKVLPYEQPIQAQDGKKAADR
jgi:hypothetical protein